MTFANAALAGLHGRPPGSLIGLPIWEFIADESGRAALRDYPAHLVREGPQPSTYHGINRRADGEFIDVQVDWSCDRDQSGRLRGFVSVITDVTERRRA